MNGLLVRIGIDATAGGWNAPTRPQTREYVYVPIPESEERLSSMFSVRRYDELSRALHRLGVELPHHLRGRPMHLDPDFATLAYGDQGRRGRQIAGLQKDDFIAFYGSFRDPDGVSHELTYALVGLFVIESIAKAVDVPFERREDNAHTRRDLHANSDDVVVWASRGRSGRLDRLVHIGEYRNGAYRVRPALIEAWGGLSVKDGYLQRSATLPRFLNPSSFLRWFAGRGESLLHSNWEE